MENNGQNKMLRSLGPPIRAGRGALGVWAGRGAATAVALIAAAGIFRLYPLPVALGAAGLFALYLIWAPFYLRSLCIEFLPDAVALTRGALTRQTTYLFPRSVQIVYRFTTPLDRRADLCNLLFLSYGSPTLLLSVSARDALRIERHVQGDEPDVDPPHPGGADCPGAREGSV